MFEHGTPRLGAWIARLLARPPETRAPRPRIVADTRALALAEAARTPRQMTYSVTHFMGLNR